MIGHLLGLCGSGEAIFTLKSLHEQIAPTINLENPGEGCDLDYVPNQAREVDITSAASNWFWRHERTLVRQDLGV